jgi:hypothetical protein
MHVGDSGTHYHFIVWFRRSQRPHGLDGYCVHAALEDTETRLGVAVVGFKGYDMQLALQAVS